MCANLSSDSYRFFVRAGVTDPDEQRQLYDLLIECDGDFVPPLSFRRSTTQAALSGSEHNPDGVRDYFNALIAQHVVLCAGNGRIVGFLSFRPEYTCDALSDGATYCYLSTMAVSTPRCLSFPTTSTGRGSICPAAPCCCAPGPPTAPRRT